MGRGSPPGKAVAACGIWVSVELVATGGIVALLGVLEEPVQISQLTLVLKEAQIRACMTYRPSDFDEAIELIAGGRVPVERLITAVSPSNAPTTSFDELASGGTAQLKVLLRPQGESTGRRLCASGLARASFAARAAG